MIPVRKAGMFLLCSFEGLVNPPLPSISPLAVTHFSHQFSVAHAVTAALRLENASGTVWVPMVYPKRTARA